MTDNYNDYRDQVDYIGIKALKAAITSCDGDEIKKFWDKDGKWLTDARPGKIIEGASVEDAIRCFGLLPCVCK